MFTKVLCSWPDTSWILSLLLYNTTERTGSSSKAGVGDRERPYIIEHCSSTRYINSTQTWNYLGLPHGLSRISYYLDALNQPAQNLYHHVAMSQSRDDCCLPFSCLHSRSGAKICLSSSETNQLCRHVHSVNLKRLGEAGREINKFSTNYF